MRKNNPRELATKERVYLFIRQFIQENHFSPTMREISEGIGISISVVHHHITDLEYEKRITRKEHSARSICLVKKDIDEPLSDHEYNGVKTVTIDIYSDNVMMSEQFSALCESFYQYLKATETDIKVWQHPKGRYLLVVDRRAVCCDIDFCGQNSEKTVMQQFYLSQFEFYKHFFERYNITFVPPRHVGKLKHEGGENSQVTDT